MQKYETRQPRSGVEGEAPTALPVEGATRAPMDVYKQVHQHPANQVMHAIGIPMIILSMIGMFWNWKWGLVFFVLGWLLQFVGHIIEGKPPAFLKTPLFMLVGPIWWAKKILKK